MRKILMTALLLQTLNTYAQHIVAVGGHYHSKYVFDYKKHNGFIILNSGDTVRGSFLYANMEFPWFNLKYYENDEKRGRYMFSKIKEAVLNGSDVALTGKDSTVFVRLSEKDKWLYRQLTFGDIKIYDQLFLVDEKYDLVEENLIVLYKGKKYKTDSDAGLFSLINKLRPDLTHIFKNNSRLEIIRELNEFS